MKATKIYGMVLGVLVMAFIFAPVVSAQQYAGILNGQWFKVNLSLKGYQIAADGETVLGKGAGSLSAYLHFAYDNLATSYTITTCMEDDIKGNDWHKGNSSGPISIGNIYGATYPQVWDLQGISLSFSDGVTSFDIYPTFYTKITADKANPATLKNASISNVSCAVYADDVNGVYGTGSCTMNGPLILPANVAKQVPAACLDSLYTFHGYTPFSLWSVTHFPLFKPERRGRIHPHHEFPNTISNLDSTFSLLQDFRHRSPAIKMHGHF